MLWHQCVSHLKANFEQVFPTSGGRSSSLWDVASIPLLLEWLDQHMDASTANEVFEVRFLCHVCAARWPPKPAPRSLLQPSALAHAIARMSRCVQVQEAFAYGISAELTRLRTAEKVRLELRRRAAVSILWCRQTGDEPDKSACLCRCQQTPAPLLRLCRSAPRVLLPSRSSRSVRTTWC